MSAIVPITLRGDNLGIRHRHLNSLVENAFKESLPLTVILDLPESSPVDKLFKIDLASKYRYVDFILNTLKQEDMVYVSRALKCTWLLEPEHQGIINPDYLETELYPQMITPAVNKMKDWLQLSLRDSRRCQEFYKYYKNDYGMSVKFLWHCAPEFILEEFPNIMDKVTPKYLKIFCEYCPQVFMLYYENLSKNSSALNKYLSMNQPYFNCYKCVFKTNTDLYLDVIEKYFERYRFSKFSPLTSEYVMKKHKQRFMNKPELYAVSLLDMKTLAKHLSNEETKELVLKLARAEYLNYWFSYKSVEPLIKKISVDERAAFKKLVFVDKEIGTKVKDWPYPPPSGIQGEKLETVFDDIKRRPEDYEFHEITKFTRSIQQKIGMQSNFAYACPMVCESITRRKTLLDQLFDRYRFFSFERTMFELRKLLAAESSVKNREFMMLVLVSKCGQNMDQLEKLMRLLVERHLSESSNLRAAIVRSMVVRACAWRLPSTAWGLLLDFARGLGLDGASPIICREGMHASVLRVLLSGEECPLSLRVAFLNDFSTLTEYKLNGVENLLIRERLPAMLLAAAVAEPSAALQRFELLLDALTALKLRVKDCPGAVEALVETVRRDPSAAESLLRRLYNERVARRELFRENFALMKTNASYLNVLRHDATLLRSTNDFGESLKTHSFNYDGFLRKLALYFGESNGLAALHIEAINVIITSDPHPCLARPLALLRADLLSIRDECHKEPKGSPRKQLEAALLANCHKSKPLDIEAIDWKTVGVKAIANRVVTCKAVDVEKYIERSLEWRRTGKLAMLLAERSGRGGRLVQVFGIVVRKQPGAAVRAALSYFRRNVNSDNVEFAVWRAVTPGLESLDLSVEQRRHLKKSLAKACFIPSTLQAEYWTDVFKAFEKISKKKSMPILCMLENLLSEVDPDVIKTVIEQFIIEFTWDKVSDDDYKMQMCNSMQVRIIAKYLLLCKSESEQTERLATVWQPFFDRLSSRLSRSTETTTEYLNDFVLALKYNKAFFDTSFVSCSPVLEQVVTDFRKLLPMEGYFHIFVTIHAIMLYHNSIHRSLKLHPEMFADAKIKQYEGSTIVGKLFGKCIGQEIRELKSKYFNSVISLYQEHLVILLREHFPYNESRNRFITAIIKGLLEVGNTEALRVAEYVMHKDRFRHDKNPERLEILSTLKETKNEEIKFFLYADMYSGCL